MVAPSTVSVGEAWGVVIEGIWGVREMVMVVGDWGSVVVGVVVGAADAGVDVDVDDSNDDE